MPNHIMVEAMPTVDVALSPSIDLCSWFQDILTTCPLREVTNFRAVSLKTASQLS